MGKNNYKDNAEKTVINIVSYTYEPPTIELLEVTAEKGFADSATDFGDGTW